MSDTDDDDDESSEVRAEGESGDSNGEVHAVEGGTGERMSTHADDVISSGVSDDLTREGNVSTREMVILLNAIRILCIVLIVVTVVLIGVTIYR